MKPIVIYLKDKDIKLTKEEFEAYLKDAYDAGYNEGVASCRRYYWWDTPPITTTPTVTFDTKTTPYDPYKITCMNSEVSNSVGD